MLQRMEKIWVGNQRGQSERRRSPQTLGQPVPQLRKSMLALIMNAST